MIMTGFNEYMKKIDGLEIGFDDLMCACVMCA